MSTENTTPAASSGPKKATTAKKTTKTTAAKAPSATKTATKKAATKKATARPSSPPKASTPATRKRPSAKKATTTNRTSSTPRSAKRTPLLERGPQALFEDASYAVAGLAVEVVDLGRQAATRAAEVRGQVAKAATEPRATLRSVAAAPARVRSGVEQARDTVVDRVRPRIDRTRHRLVVEAESVVAGFEKALDVRAATGRERLGALQRDERVRRLLDQATNARRQVKGAVTSVGRTATVAADVVTDNGDANASASAE